MIRSLAALALALGCAAGHAACDTGLAERMHGKLHPDRALDHERAVCEPWRAYPGRFIVVLPMARPASEPDHAEFDLDVLVVQQADNGNTDRATVISRLLEPKALTEDMTRISSIKVDVARYTLAPDVRAFGLRVIHQGTARDDPYESERLTLYVPQGPKLLKVLSGLETTLEKGAWDARCAGRFVTERVSVSVARSMSNGYADLVLRQNRSESVSSTQGEECVTREKPATFGSSTLHFDGARYRAPQGVTLD